MENRKIVILTGAGMSAESGISTFRDSDGLWEHYPVQQVASIEGYEENPELVLNFYNARRKELLNVKPNHGHLMVAALEKYFNVTVITQNVDNLHERAGSSHVIHLHGELMKATSTRNPNDPSCIEGLTPERCEIHLGDKAADGSQLRPYIVWFGESVPKFEEAVNEASTADIFIIIGTSMQVYPAAGLIRYIRPDTQVYLIDPKEVKVYSSQRVHTIRKGASEGMDELLKILLNC